MRILGIDYGDARIGLALSDASATLCGRAWTLTEWNLDRAVDAIADVVRTEGVERIVLGLPKNMDGTEGPRAEKSRMVAQRLTDATGREVVLWDERRSSIEAHKQTPFQNSKKQLKPMTFFVGSRLLKRNSKHY